MNDNRSTETNPPGNLTNVLDWLRDNSIVAIWVGSAATGLLIALTGVCCFLRKRAAKKKAVADLAVKTTSSGDTTYLSRTSPTVSDFYDSFTEELELGSRRTLTRAKESVTNLPSFEDMDEHAEKVLDSAKQLFDSIAKPTTKSSR